MNKSVENFLLLTRIPRQSGHEEAVSRFLCQWAADRGLTAVRDSANNVIIDKPGAPGLENAPRTILQAHMDMVCVAEEGRVYDPLTDPIRVINDGETLTAEVIHGELCHIKKGTKGGGGWIRTFDFMSDYSNRATGAQEKGGQLTAKIRPLVPQGRRVAGWKFDKTELYPDVVVNDFVVRTLDTSMTYEPIFAVRVEPRKEPENPPAQPTKMPNLPAPIITYTEPIEIN